jgi:hypothetical protein
MVVTWLLALECDSAGSRQVSTGSPKWTKRGIDVQVLSLTAPGVEQLDPADAVVIARDANDVGADVVARNPTNFLF